MKSEVIKNYIFYFIFFLLLLLAVFVTYKTVMVDKDFPTFTSDDFDEDGNLVSKPYDR